jgi:hypothetical protein
MKSKIAVLAFALLTSAVVLADSPAILSVVSTANTYTVYYKTSGTGKVKISIVNEANKLVYYETLNNVASFSRPYNFSQLEEGQYTIILEDKNGRQVEKVNYTQNHINSVVKVTRLQADPNKYLVSLANNGSEKVLVRIYNGEHTILHEQTVQVDGSFGMVYNLGQAKLDSNVPLTFEIVTSNKVELVNF